MNPFLFLHADFCGHELRKVRRGWIDRFAENQVITLYVEPDLKKKLAKLPPPAGAAAL